MKNLTQTRSRRLLQALTMQGSLTAAILILAGAATTASAQTPIDRNSTSGALTSGSDWAGGVAPGANNIAVWGSGVPGADTEPLGASTAWEGIQILSPGGPVTITADGNALTNGAVGAVGLNGIDLSSATENLTLNNAVVLSGVQNWRVATGQSLSVDGPLSAVSGAAVRIYLPTGANVYVTNGSPNSLLGTNFSSGATGDYLATLNDTDMAGLVTSGSGLQVVGGSTISGLYTINTGTGATPTFNGNFAVANFVTNNLSYGWRVSGSETWNVAYLNEPQADTASTVTYYGVTYPAWQFIHSSGRNVTIGTILITTNVGGSAVWDNGGGLTVFGGGGPNDMRIFQNNTAAPFIMANVLHATANANLIKMGPGLVSLQAASSGTAFTTTFQIYEGTFQVDNGGSFVLSPVSVYGGTLGLAAPNTASSSESPITIYSGATNNIVVNGSNAQVVTTNLTFNAGSTLQFTYSNTIAPSTTTAALSVTQAGSVLTLNSPVNVRVGSGSISTGTFPLVKYTGSLGGGGFAALSTLTLPPHIYGYLSNDTVNSFIDLVVTNVDQPIVWNVGNPGGTWDIGVSANWLDQSANAVTYLQQLSLGDNVLFNDAATPTGAITVTLNTNVSPSSVTVNNSANTYTISGSGGIGGTGGLTKNGSGTITLSTANSFAGGIYLNNGTVIFSSLGNLGSSGINFNGGTLQYNGNTTDISTRTVTFASGGATINTAGQSVTFSNLVGSGGLGGLTKAGTGTLTLMGTNTFNGNTVVSQGTLALGPNSYLTNSAAIIVNSSAILDAATSGVNLSLSTKVNQILAGTGQVNGTVTISPQTTISPATNGVIGTLAINGSLTINGGTLDMDVNSSTHDLITSTGNLTIDSGTVQINATGTLPYGRYILITYTGSLISQGIVTPSGFNQAGAVGTLDTSVPNQLALVVAPIANDNIVWAGSGTTWDVEGSDNWLKSSTPWAFTNGDTVTFNDSGTAIPTISIINPVLPTNTIVSNTVATYTFTAGGGSIQGTGSLLKEGTGTLIIETPGNTYSGGTTISNGTLQFGNGAGGDIGPGNVNNNGALVFAEGDGNTHIVKGSISGPGSLTVNATGSIVVLATNNSYTGPTVIGAGTLQVGQGTGGSLGNTASVTDNGALTLDFTNTTAFSGNISGSGSFGTVGTGVITLAGSLSYQGSTEVSNGVIKISSNNQLPNADNVSGSTGSLNVDGGLNTPSVLDMDGYNITVNALSGAANTFVGIITNSSTSTGTTNVLTVLNVVSATNTYNGQIMDHGLTGADTAVFVTGPGTLVLNPFTNNLFSGGLTVSNSTVWIGAPGSASTANIFESTEAPGTSLITLLGTNTSLYLNGGQPGASTTPTYNPETDPLSVPAGAYVYIWACNRGDYGGTLTGSGTVDWVDQYVRGGVSGDWSAFTGQIVIQGNNAFSPGNVGNVGFGDTNGLPLATVTMITNVDFHAGSLSGSTLANWPTNASGVFNPFPIGALQGGDDSVQLEGSTTAGNANGVNLVYEIGGLNTSTTYGGGIVDPVGILKVGTGTLTLNNGGVVLTNTFLGSDGFTEITEVGYQAPNLSYSGTTTISNGVLKLCAPVVITNSSVVTIAAASAELDASSMGYATNEIVPAGDGLYATNEVLATNSLFEVITNQTLAGIGTLNGFLQADQYSFFKPGLPTGTFNVTSNASLAGVVTIDLDNADAPENGELAAPGITISNTATLVVTNIGPGLFNQTTYTLFNHPVSGFASVTLPATDPTGTTNYMWQNNLSVNGSITLTNGGLVAVTINPNPTNIVYSATANPGSLTLSWPSDHTGWTLQSQTNAPPSLGITGNWYNVAGSTATDQIVVPFIPTDSVFYRLVYTNTP